MLCCVPRQHSLLDNASVSGIAGPRAPGTASANTAIDGARLQPGCRCYCVHNSRDSGSTENTEIFSRAATPMARWPGLRARVRDLRGQNTIPDFYPGLVRTAPENLFNNRQWRPRRPSTRGGDGDRLALGRSPMGPQTPSRPTASSPTDQARFQWGLQQRDIDNQSAAAESPRVATDTGKTSLNDDLQVLERGRAEPSAAVDSAPPFSQARGRS
jgi:hypothetical protein